MHADRDSSKHRLQILTHTPALPALLLADNHFQAQAARHCTNPKALHHEPAPPSTSRNPKMAKLSPS